MKRYEVKFTSSDGLMAFYIYNDVLMEYLKRKEYSGQTITFKKTFGILIPDSVILTRVYDGFKLQYIAIDKLEFHKTTHRA